ncbi:MAG TPA: M28 family peptidase [Sphingobium sp.]
MRWRSAAAICGAMLLAGGASTITAARTAPGEVEGARLSEITRTLASDAFAGRAPGSPGEAKTIAFLVEQFKALGLEPGGEKGGWTQTVPLLRTQVDQSAPVTMAIGGKDQSFAQGRDIYVSTLRDADRAQVASAPLVFVGYGVTAPERNWDDFKGVDLKGKVAVFLVNDPDFEAASGEPVAGVFGGRAMTYYGRWTYKFEEAARRGAIAALIVHDTPGAGYGWNTVIAPGGENFGLAGATGGPQALALQGWLSGEAATRLFAASGLDLAALRAAARRRDFAPVALAPARMSADIAVTRDHIESHNVIAKLTGDKRPEETISFAAHWDAYGVDPTPGPKKGGIRSGALDDAIGVAGVLELARLFAAGPRPDRTLVFAAWTAEERGLLGSEWFARSGLYPADKMVANMTLDVLQTAGAAHDVVLIGAGQNDLERYLADAAKAQGRTVTPDAKPERGLFYRADHFSLARRGVPTLLLMAIGGGADLVKGGRAAGDKWVSDYTANCYHQICDSWSADWDLTGAVQDVSLFHAIGAQLANGKQWPQWNAGSEFAKLRNAP